VNEIVHLELCKEDATVLTAVFVSPWSHVLTGHQFNLFTCIFKRSVFQ